MQTLKTKNLSAVAGVNVWIEMYAYEGEPVKFHGGAIYVQYEPPIVKNKELHRIPLTEEEFHQIYLALGQFYDNDGKTFDEYDSENAKLLKALDEG